MTYSGAQFRASNGVISAVDDEITLPCPGSASATIHLAGTFVGTLEVTGAATVDSADNGKRIIIKSGVGSLGINTISLDGTHDTEWRVVTGGYQITVRCTAYTSGSLTIRIGASNNPSSILIDGPVHSATENALRGSRAFLASTVKQPVTSTEILYVIIANPVDSGKFFYIENRRFSNDSASILEYQAYVDPTAVLTETGVVPNRYIGSAEVSSAVFTWQAAAVGVVTMGGTLGSAELVKAEDITVRDVLVVLPPGKKLGFAVTGAGAAIGIAARLSITLEWYEEPVP
jgi:hypothetical protein